MATVVAINNNMQSAAAHPNTVEWHSDLCDCCDDCGICCTGLYCPCYLYAQNVERLGKLSALLLYNPTYCQIGCIIGLQASPAYQPVIMFRFNFACSDLRVYLTGVAW
jgi:Cys-rich protein (TIGR01571 family)